MQVDRVFAFLFLLNILTSGCCTILALTGYAASNPGVRNFLIKSGFGTFVSRKSERLYEISNFRYVSDQGTNIRKAQMDTHDIVEVDPESKDNFSNSMAVNTNRSGLQHVHNYTGDEDRLYSERVFSVLNEMDKNSCISRLLCEIAVDPSTFGVIGIKIDHYVKSVPPVTWNSATFPYLEAFQAGLSSSKDMCSQHYSTCTYNLKKVIKFLWIFMNPILKQTARL